MNELKSVYIDRTGDWVRSGNDTGKFYLKDEVDAAIAELKAKLEDAKATAYAEMVDAGMENRRLKRALWLARAEKARFVAIVIDNHPYTQVLHFTSRKRDESGKPLGVARTAMEWWKMFQEVERKCRAKAEEYK